MNRNSLSIEHVSHSYGSVKALNNLTFQVSSGELFGLIGPDGAGKTTLFRILTTLILADEGKATVCDYDVVKDYKAIRNICGYMPGRFSLYPDLTVEENLRFFATVFHTTLEANYDLVRDIYVQLEPFKTRQAGKLSGGMKQKLALCCALIHRPRILFLDEPTTGVDPVSRVEFWDMLSRLKNQGITMLVSTPYMDEAARCDRILLIKEGQTLALNTPNNIRAAYAERLYSLRGKDMFRLLKTVRHWEGAKTCYAFGDAHHLTLQPTATVEGARHYLRSQGFDNPLIEAIEPSIEDCFMALNKE